MGLSAAATPGPFLAFLLAQTLKNGGRCTLPATLAPLFSDGPIIILVLLILTQTPSWLLNILQIVGGLFILYLARDSFLASKKTVVVATDADPPISMTAMLAKATLMNGLSPNPYLFWSIVAGPIVLTAWRQSPNFGLSFMLGFYSTLIGGFAGFVLLFATARRLDERVNQILSGVSAIALFIFGLYQLWHGLANFRF